MFAIMDVQRLKTHDVLEQRHSHAKGELNTVRMHAGHIWQFLQGDLDKDGGHTCIEWFNKVADELEYGLDSPKWESFASQNHNELISNREYPGEGSRYVDNARWKEYKFDLSQANPRLDKEATEIVRKLEELKNEKEEISKLESEANSSESEKSFRWTWPWIFCFALALRITKVTADLCKYKESDKGKEKDIIPEAPVESDAP